ncbi:MAG TPA: isoprenylcysteine carboxylmethyltransferase family protein [Sphingobacteriaceae bacterium]
MVTEAFIKVFSLTFFFLYLLIAFAWPTVRTYKSTGVNPVTFGTSDTAHDFIGRWFKILIGLTLISIITSWFPDGAYQYLSPFTYLLIPVLHLVGVVLGVLSLVWISIAQFQMGNSWRIGLDHQNKTQLIRHGLFGISRNPVFLGMLVSLLGFFLLLPNALTLLVLVCGYVLIQIQIRLEEDFLVKQHADEYIAYCKKVKRLI